MKILIKRKKGFTIVELLVVIVVIGILATITIISYTGISNRAKTAQGQSQAVGVMKKTGIYVVDGPISSFPTSYGSLTSAATTSSYFLSGSTFTTISSSATTPAMTATSAQPGLLDYYLCGTNTTAAATRYGEVNVVTGAKFGYWDYLNGTLNTTTNSIGAVSGLHTNGYNITCYKVGIADTAAAVARAIYNESSGSFPLLASTINNNVAIGAKLPAGLTVNVAAPTSPTATTQVRYDCGVTTNNSGPCLSGTAGRIAYWDTTAGTPGIQYVYIGANTTNFWTPAS